MIKKKATMDATEPEWSKKEIDEFLTESERSEVERGADYWPQYFANANDLDLAEIRRWSKEKLEWEFLLATDSTNALLEWRQDHLNRQTDPGKASGKKRQEKAKKDRRSALSWLTTLDPGARLVWKGVVRNFENSNPQPEFSRNSLKEAWKVRKAKKKER